MAAATCDIGLIGLAVMGQNLVLNMNDHGYKVAVFNRTVSKVDEFLGDEAKGTKVVGTHSVEELCASLKLPRRRSLRAVRRQPKKPLVLPILKRRLPLLPRVNPQARPMTTGRCRAARPR